MVTKKINTIIFRRIFIKRDVTKYFPRQILEKKIKEHLNQSKLIIVYGPKLSGKTTTLNKVLEGRKGVISVYYRKETNLLKELGRILKVPEKKISLSIIKTIFSRI